MKTINLKRVLGAALLMMTVAYVSAIEPVVSITGQKKIVLVIDNINEATNLVIKDNNGYKFFTQAVEKSSEKFAKIFDLTTLPDGSYSIEFEGSTKVTNFALNIVDNKISFSSLVKTIAYKPMVVERDNKVTVTKFNPENKPLNVSIYNNIGELVYEEVLSGKIDLGRIYNFSNFQGTYTISMQSDDKTYTQTVSIK